MKKTLLTAITISALLISLMVTACPHPVRADSADHIHFIDAGLTIYSPVNMTYYNTNLFLNISLGSSGLMGGLDPNISMNYSIDNTYNGSVPLESTREIHVVSRAVALTVLPDVPNGSHNLTIYLYGLNQRTYDPKYLSFTLSVYFSTTGNPNLNPTISPTTTPTPTPSPSSTPTPSPSPSSTPSSSPTPTPSSTQQPTLEPTSGLSSAPRISPIKEVDYLGWLWAAIIGVIVLIITSIVYLATLGKIRNRK